RRADPRHPRRDPERRRHARADRSPARGRRALVPDEADRRRGSARAARRALRAEWSGVMNDGVWTDARILIVDDEPMNVRLLERLLTLNGYREMVSLTDSREVLDRFRTWQPDLVMLDLMMPHLDGVAVLQQLREECAPGVYVPVLMLTADASPEARRRCLE